MRLSATSAGVALPEIVGVITAHRTEDSAHCCIADDERRLTELMVRGPGGVGGKRTGRAQPVCCCSCERRLRRPVAPTLAMVDSHSARMTDRACEQHEHVAEPLLKTC
jgi:hypothetical protein